MKFITSFIIALVTAMYLPAQINVAGNALQYNGTSCINFGSIDFGFQNQLTIMLWVRWDTNPQLGNRWANMATINSTNSPDDGVFWMQHNSDNSKFEFALTTLNSSGNKVRNMIFSTTAPQQGSWYHLAAVYTGTAMILYVNGVAEATTNKTGNVNTMQSQYNFTLGAWAQSNNNYRKFHGSIDEMSVWTRALTLEEIQSYKNRQLNGTESNLVAYWRFDETSGSTIYDLSPSGLNGQNIDCVNATAATRIASDAPLFSGLPVNLLFFQPSCGSDSNVVITWATASENNNDYFTLFRSYNGYEWEIVNRIDGSGNSNEVTYYNYTDRKPLNDRVYYKLMQTDFNGDYEEFNMVSVFCRDNAKNFEMFPNPASTSLTMTFNNISEEEKNLNTFILNPQGQVLITQQQICHKGFNECLIDISELPAGSYFLHTRFGSTLIQTREFIKN